MLLYIDPGPGSMLFTMLIGVIGAAVYSLKILWIKHCEQSELTIP